MRKVWKTEDWKLSEFHSLVINRAHIKQLFDVTQISDGKFLVNMKNSLNGLHFGFGVPANNVKLVGGLHGPANLLSRFGPDQVIQTFLSDNSKLRCCQKLIIARRSSKHDPPSKPSFSRRVSADRDLRGVSCQLVPKTPLHEFILQHCQLFSIAAGFEGGSATLQVF
jgi:hypothetical protein